MNIKECPWCTDADRINKVLRGKPLTPQQQIRLHQIDDHEHNNHPEDLK